MDYSVAPPAWPDEPPVSVATMEPIPNNESLDTDIAAADALRVGIVPI